MNERQTGLPIRQTSDLRKGRISLPGARYFITISAQRPERRLALPETAGAVSGVLARIEKDGDATFLASTIMPDHLHLLALLTGRLTLSRMVGKLKALTEPAMRVAELRWQENFFEHRLRPEDRAGDYARYIFLNPYRAGLIRQNEEWPWWRRSPEHGFDFLLMLDDARFPPSEWLRMDDEALGVMPETVGND
jgi:REP element-mobilizing transposase RayT